jgi:hypothetical protein
MTWWHGGRYPADGILTPQETSRSGDDGDGFVYITTDRGLAATYAATLTGSWLMEVEPVGDVEPDPDSLLGTSFRCREAKVLRRYDLPRQEREERRRTVERLGWRG